MPVSVNGIGTRYYGQRNPLQHPAVCEHCNKEGLLSSYDTTLYFVFFLVPLIPLGRYRVLNQCPSCGKHRVMKLRKWEEIRKTEIDAAKEAWELDRASVENARRLLGTMANFQARDEFRKIMLELVRQFRDDAEMLKAVAGCAEYFTLLKEAESLQRQILQLDPDDREARENLGRILCRRLKPAEAEPYLVHILEEGNIWQLGLILGLVESYQAVGEHRDALRLLDEIERIAPEWKQEKAIKRSRKLSQRHRATGKKVISPQMAAASTTSAADRPDRGASIARWTMPVVVLGALVLFLAISLSMAKSQKVWVVSGIEQPYTVRINDQSFDLLPETPVQIELPEGTIRIAAVDGSFPVEPVTAEIHNSLLGRLFARRTWILNPDRTAILELEKGYYSSDAKDRADLGSEFLYFAAKPFYEFRGIDHEFEALPDEITTTASGIINRESINLVTGNSPLYQQYVLWEIYESGQEQQATETAKRLAQWGRVRWASLQFLAGVMEEDTLRSFLQDGLSQRPVRVDWHCYYQDWLDQRGENEALETEYLAMLEQSPESAELLYLAARAHRDPARTVDWMGRIASMDNLPDSVLVGCADYLWYAGRFEEAAKLSSRAFQVHPRNAEALLHDMHILQAADRFDEALELLGRIERVVLHVNEMEYWEYGEFERLELLCDKGDWQQADHLVEAYKQKIIERNLQASVQAEQTRYMDGLRAYYAGNAEKAYSLIPEDYVPFELALFTKDFQGAEELLGEFDVEGGVLVQNHLVLSVAAYQAGNHQLADRHREIAAESLSEGLYSARVIGKALQGATTTNPETLTLLPLEPSIKIPALILLGQLYPDHRPHYWGMARQLNYDLDFPRHLYDEVLAQTSHLVRIE